MSSAGVARRLLLGMYALRRRSAVRLRRVSSARGLQLPKRALQMRRVVARRPVHLGELLRELVCQPARLQRARPRAQDVVRAVGWLVHCLGRRARREQVHLRFQEIGHG